jgi:endoglucanase
MGLKFILILVFLTTLLSSKGQVKDIPFTKGFNLPEWFENFDDITDIKFKKHIRQDFENMKALGCDVVRLPVEFFNATGPYPNFTIDPMLFMFIDEVVDWAEDLEMYLIIDNHSFDDHVETSPGVLDTLMKVWPQIASHYKNRSNYILYEILNEPHGNSITDENWNNIQQLTINAIRTVDKKHTIIVGPYNWNNYNNLYQMPVYADTNLIYTFHFYDPYLFTSVTDIRTPYPYDPDRMPEMPTDWDEWYQQLYNEYPFQGNNANMKHLIDTAIKFREIRQVPIYCGEFGANMLNKEIVDRAAWISCVRSYLEENNIPWTMWSYINYMGIFDPLTPQLFEYNMDTTIAKALGINFPVQKKFKILPDSTGFFLYDDYVPQNIIENNWAIGGIAQYYSQNEPKIGNFCLSWSEADQYGNLGFRFYPVRDLSQLQSEDYVLDFWMRCNSPGIKIELRFEDTDTGSLDHAWRQSVILDNSIAAFDGTWSHVRVPLTDFMETGAYEDGNLFEPEGKFDWTRIERFDFVAEYMSLHDVEFFFDQIQIVDSSVSTSFEPIINDGQNEPGLSVISNFTGNIIQINFNIPKTSTINIALYNTAGQEIGQLANGVYNSGSYTINWNSDKLAAGIYFIRMQSSNYIATRKLIISY